MGQLPADRMVLGCELDRRNPGAGDFLHIVAPPRYIRSKTAVDNGWGSDDDVLVLANLYTLEPTVYTGDR